jgi:transposase
VSVLLRRGWLRTTDIHRANVEDRLRYARRTSRLSLVLEQITLALGETAEAGLTEQLGIMASDSTLLRHLRHRTIENQSLPRVLGIDDWAWRRGHLHGTILCDLERGKVIDLLPNIVRSARSAGYYHIPEQR